MAVIKNLINFNKSLFDAFTSIVIPSLIGIVKHPDEFIRIAASDASWLGKHAKRATLSSISNFYLNFFSIFNLQPHVRTSVIRLGVCSVVLYPMPLDVAKH